MWFFTVCILAWLILELVTPAQVQPRKPPEHSLSFYTPAHSTFLEAVRDYFDIQPKPVQPIAYSHAMHLASGMQCLNCHTGADTASNPVLPSIKMCMICHQAIAADKPEVKKVAEYFNRSEEIPWQRVDDYSFEMHVKFNHASHSRVGVDCAVCHGDMTKQTVAQPVVNLNMGFCLDCHLQRKASVDCTVCHY